VSEMKIHKPLLHSRVTLPTPSLRQPTRAEDGPDSIERLEELLSEPTEQVVETMRRVDGPIVLLGVAGKMGPTLARMICRADEQAGISRRVIGVSRFRSSTVVEELESCGIETITADLLDSAQLAALPDVPNVIYLAGLKFGADGNEPRTWAMNTVLPAMVCQKYAASRIVAFSTGNVYPTAPIRDGGSTEADALDPVGEYAMSCLGRERVFQHYAMDAGTKVALLRLSYACELRYGVLVDIARSVWNRRPIDLTNSGFTVIWQGDANAMALRALEHTASPAVILNVAGPELMSVKRVATMFGELMGREVSFSGIASDSIRLNNGQLGHRLFGYPQVSVQRMIHWIADWVKQGGADLGKPTHFEVRNGKY
jgi:nucleoside-diphosphate-sugar epimerase